MVHDVPFFRGAVQHNLFFVGGEVFVRHVGAHAHLAAHIHHDRPHERAPRRHRTLLDRQVRVGDQRGIIHRAHNARAGAGGARAARVEREVLRAERLHLGAAHRADDRPLERDVRRRVEHVAVRAGVVAQAGGHEAQAVEQFAHRAEGAADAGHARPLVQRERRRHMLDRVELRFAALRDAAARVRGEPLQVAARAFRVEHAERERRFARPGDARHGHHFADRHLHIHALEIVHPRARDVDCLRHTPLPLQ